jgi:hypothetical protein
MINDKTKKTTADWGGAASSLLATLPGTPPALQSACRHDKSALRRIRS